VNLSELKHEAAKIVIAERSRYLHVCHQVTDGVNTVYRGSDFNCLLWIEQRCLEAYARWMADNWRDCHELIGMKFGEGMSALSGEVK
jgi:hypothetical protein